MNLVKEIKDILKMLEKSQKAGFKNVTSPELIAQVKILNGKIELLQKAIQSGKLQERFAEHYEKMKNIQYSIHHQLLFGPLSRILGIVNLIEADIESGRQDEVDTLARLLCDEVRSLKAQIMKILEGSDKIELSNDSTN